MDENDCDWNLDKVKLEPEVILDVHVETNDSFTAHHPKADPCISGSAETEKINAHAESFINELPLDYQDVMIKTEITEDSSSTEDPVEQTGHWDLPSASAVDDKDIALKTVGYSMETNTNVKKEHPQLFHREIIEEERFYSTSCSNDFSRNDERKGAHSFESPAGDILNFVSIKEEPNIFDTASSHCSPSFSESEYSLGSSNEVLDQSPSVFKNSENSITSLNEKPLSCDQCSYTCTRKCDLKKHSRLPHSDKPYACCQCSAQFRKKNYLRQHLIIHSDEKPFPCDQCSSRFRTKGMLTSHLRAHSDKKPFSCDQCSFTCKRRHSLRIHMLSHSDDRPISSETEKKCQSADLLVHSDDRPFSCNQCSAQFKLRRHLKQHLAIHSNDRPFSCDECSARFKRERTLQEHLVIHSNDKPFPCDQCSAQFRTKKELKKHSQVHSDEKPFSCNQCSFSCKRKYGLKTHMLSHSNNTSSSCC